MGGAQGPQAAIAVETPTMSLQDFATEVFGKRSAPSPFEVAPIAGPADAEAIADDGAPALTGLPDALLASSTGPDATIDDGQGDASASFSALSAFADVQGDLGSVDASGAGPAGATFDPSPVADPGLAVAPPTGEPDGAPAPYEVPSGFGALTEAPTDDGARVRAGATDVFVADPPLPPLESPESFEPTGFVDDDLLPTGRGSGGISLPNPFQGGGSQRVKIAAAALAGLVVALLGYRLFLAPSPPAESVATATPATEAPETGVAGGDQSNIAGPGVVATLDAAQLAAAEVELRAAGLDAQAHYAETGSYAQDPVAWDAAIAGPVVALGGTLAEGTLHVVSDADAACFETSIRSGTTVAVGVTAQGLTFASDATGASICTADAAHLAGWGISLAPPGA